VLNSLKNQAVYLAAIGGAAIIYAKCIVKVKGVYKPEFGMAEAIWEFEVKDFPLIVAMDSKGKSLYEEILKKSQTVLQRFIQR
jgi:tartrate dehydratase beta subunit/fumarate hydratase class I family protein